MILTLGRWGQEDEEFEASLSYTGKAAGLSEILSLNGQARGGAELGQQLRVFAAFPEDPSLISSPRVGWFVSPCISSYRGSTPPSGFCGYCIGTCVRKITF